MIEANGGTPPVTYTQFCHVTLGVGPPPRPCPPVDLGSVTFASLPEELMAELKFYTAVPTPDMMGFERTIEDKVYKVSNLLQSNICSVKQCSIVFVIVSHKKVEEETLLPKLSVNSVLVNTFNLMINRNRYSADKYCTVLFSVQGFKFFA